ncbi:MAG: GrlR family regulatory protein [Parvibaculaceae bacterium]
MSMRNGLYKIDFETQRGGGQGVVVLKDGRIWGGDSGWFYVGTYEQTGDRFKARVKISAHTKHEHITSVVGMDSADLKLKGTAEGDAVTTTGIAKQAPDITFVAKLERLSD